MWKVLDKLGVLFVNFFQALKFAAFDYDAKLKITKTPQQRAMIWIGVTFVTIVSIFAILIILGSFIKPLLDRQ